MSGPLFLVSKPEVQLSSNLIVPNRCVSFSPVWLLSIKSHQSHFKMHFHCSARSEQVHWVHSLSLAGRRSLQSKRNIILKRLPNYSLYVLDLLIQKIGQDILANLADTRWIIDVRSRRRNAASLLATQPSSRATLKSDLLESPVLHLDPHYKEWINFNCIKLESWVVPRATICLCGIAHFRVKMDGWRGPRNEGGGWTN